MDSGKIAWKNWLREIAPNPFNQASLENISSGSDQLSNDIIETPLYCNKNNCHQCKYFVTSVGIVLKFLWPLPTILEGKTERIQFKSLLTNNLPGCTQVATKWSFPNKDCNIVLCFVLCCFICLCSMFCLVLLYLSLFYVLSCVVVLKQICCISPILVEWWD